MYTDIPNLIIKSNDGRLTGVLSKRNYSSETVAEKREAELFQLAVSLLGREPTFSELNRGRPVEHPQVPRGEWPTELRYVGIEVSKPPVTTQEQQLRSELKRLREEQKAESLTPRERMRQGLIRQTEEKIAALESAADAKRQRDELRQSEDYQSRQWDLDVFRVVAGFDPDAPTYEMTAVDEMRRRLDAGDFDGFDKLADPYQQRVEERQAQKLEELNSVIKPVADTASLTLNMLSSREVAETISDQL